MGRYPRAVQAMYLLSKCLAISAGGADTTVDDIIQIDRTLRALSHLTASEVELADTLYCVPEVMCLEYVSNQTTSDRR